MVIINVDDYTKVSQSNFVEDLKASIMKSVTKFSAVSKKTTKRNGVTLSCEKSLLVTTIVFFRGRYL